jgi:hypothetical protein
MHCPIQNTENSEILLDYCARKLSPEATAEFERHMVGCADCRSFAEKQRTVLSALDAWEAPPVSEDFDRKLYARIEAVETRSWWRRWLEDGFGWKPALSFGAASAAVAVAFFVYAPQLQENRKLEIEPEQVERALEDLEMLKQLSGTGTQNL